MYHISHLAGWLSCFNDGNVENTHTHTQKICTQAIFVSVNLIYRHTWSSQITGSQYKVRICLMETSISTTGCSTQWIDQVILNGWITTELLTIQLTELNDSTTEKAKDNKWPSGSTQGWQLAERLMWQSRWITGQIIGDAQWVKKGSAKW